MVTWEVSGETHSRHAWWTLERSSLHEQGVGDRNSSAPFTSHVLSQQMRHTGLWVSSSPPEELECIFFSFDQTGGSLGCALIAPVRSSFRAVSRVAVTCGVNDEGSEPSCKSASTVFNTA